MPDSPSEHKNSYDQVPYKSHPFVQAHPDRLATIASLFGIRPALVERCRVLELGCASGGNLLPMADQFPSSEFIGIDASLRQIQDGNRTLTQSGLTNVELRQQDILEFTDDRPFDFIISHGVYSWVPTAVQHRMLQICRDCLAPNGIAYVSYNTYPGWHMRGMIRDVMRYRAQSFSDPRQKLSQARGLLTFLSNSVNSENSPYGLMLKQELESIAHADDSYLQHEHLEEVNDPIYFHQFAELASAAGLQYLGEADFGVMSVENFPEQVQSMLLSVSRDTIEIEQYMDFLRNRAFRQTLLVRDDCHFDRTPEPRALLKLRVSSSAKSETETVDLRSSEQVAFQRGSSVLRTTDPVVKAAMLHLRRVWPQSVPFGELASLARSIASGHPAAVDTDVLSPVTEQLARTLLRCFATRTIDLHCAAPQFVSVAGELEFPRISALARVQASLGSSVTNRLHETVRLDDVQRRVVSHCDGTRSRADLVTVLCGALQQGELTLHHRGVRVTDAETLKRLADDMVRDILSFLAGCGLLVSQDLN